jgi:hypothetical protein
MMFLNIVSWFKWVRLKKTYTYIITCVYIYIHMDGWMDGVMDSWMDGSIFPFKLPSPRLSLAWQSWELWVLVTGVDITCVYIIYLMLFYITLYHTILYCYSILHNIYYIY